MTQPHAGWYPDPTPAQEGDQRYWDGQQWTAHTAPGASAATPVSKPADWYVDPTEPQQLRYWNGTAWTHHTHARTSADPASPAQPEPSPTADTSVPQASAVPAGWHPDGRDVSGQTLRYWDGSQWTDHTHAAGTSAPRRRKRVSGKVLAASIGVPVLVVGAVGAGALVMREAALPECGTLFDVESPSGAFTDLATAEPICTDTARGLDFTAPMRDQTERDATFAFPATVRHDDPDRIADLDYFRQFDWGFELFADPGLTTPLPLSVEDAEGADGGWIISSQEAPEATAIYSDDYAAANGLAVDYEQVLIRSNYDQLTGLDSDEVVGKAPSQWGLRDQYYLVRYVDERGEPLDRPVVSEFGFTQELATPQVVVGAVEGSPGTVQLQWQPVDGAEWYLIVKSSVSQFADQGRSPYRNYEAVGATREAAWDTTQGFDGDFGAPYDSSGASYLSYYRTAQNNALRMFNYSEDDLVLQPDAEEYQVGWEFGVIAIADMTDDSVTASAIGAIPADAAEANRPFAFAEYQWEERYPDTTWVGTEFASVAEIPTTLPIVNLAGAVVEADAMLVLDTVAYADEVVRPGVVQVGLYAVGTQLGTPILLDVSDGESVATLVDEFNERARLTGATTGGTYDTSSVFTIEGAEVVDVAPLVDYPIYGTHPFTEFIAAHMVARHEAIDISAWLAQPGTPDIADAVQEVRKQNPYVYVEDYSWSTDGILYVRYSYPEGEYQQHQAELKAHAAEVAASLGIQNASNRDTAVAINTYLVDHVEYAYDALAVADSIDQQGSSNTWQADYHANGILYAWEANGAFDRNQVVCAGYSLAFVAIAMETQLHAVYVSGYVTASGGSHAWNKVNIDGTWLAIDSTWNDSPNGNKYLLIRDSEFTGSATRTENEYWVVDANMSLFATP